MADDIGKIVEEKHGEDEPSGLWFWFAIIVVACSLIITYMSPSKEVMDLLAPILFSSLGAALILITVEDIRKGEISIRRARIRREERPVLFWIVGIVYVSMGVFLLVTGLTFRPAVAQDAAPMEYKTYHEKALAIDVGAHTVGLEKFLEFKEQGATVVDLRSREEFDRGHIKGAVHLGADIAEEKISALVPDKNTTILLYCSNSFFPTRRISLTGVSLPQLITLGYENTYMLDELWHGGNMEGREQLKQKGLWEEMATE